MKKIQLNVIDKAVAFINPQRAVERLVARQKLEKFNYDAVKYSRERKGPSSLSGAEDFRSNYDRVELMKRARDLAENVGLVRSLLMKFGTHVAGSITYQARCSNPEVNTEVEEFWNDWWDKCDISTRHTGGMLMQVAIMSMLRDGDFLFVLVRDNNGNLKLQGIESDRVGDPYKVYTSPDLLGGIHIDISTGAPTAYDIFSRSIGDAYTYQITASAAQCFHLFDPLRIDQYRGVSAFHTAINDALDIYEIINYEKMAAKYASSQSGIIKRNNNNASDLSTLENSDDLSGNAIKLETIESGRISYLEPGEDIVFPSGPNRPSGAFGEFHKILLRNICLGLGIPYSFAVDPSAMSGPTARLEMQQAGRTFKRYQTLLNDKILKPIKNIVIADAVSRGIIKQNEGSRTTKGIFNFGANVSIDLGRESASAISEFKAGLRTAHDIYAERGGDAESAMRIRAQEAKLIQDLASEYGVQPNMISDIAIIPAGADTIKEATAKEQGIISDKNLPKQTQPEINPETLTEMLVEELEGKKKEIFNKLNPKELKMLVAGMMGGIELGKYDGIDFTPPEGAREAAKRALDVREKKPTSQKGMTAVGIARARDLINGVKFSPDTIRRMKAFFDRHEVDKKGATWDEQGKGWQAWNGWGGDVGYAWARKVIRQMEARDKEKNLQELPKCPGGEVKESYRKADGDLLEERFEDCGTGSGGFKEGNICASGGGRGIKNTGDGTKNRKTVGSAIWGSSKSNSFQMAGYSAKLMGVEGFKYKEEWNSPKALKTDTVKILDAINNDKIGSEEPTFHGFQNIQNKQFKIGESVKIPLTATASDIESAEGYGIERLRQNQKGKPTIYEFPKGTKIAPYSVNKTKDDIASFGIYGEAITSGEFKISDIKKRTIEKWYEDTQRYEPLEIDVITLKQSKTFNPKTNSWN